MFYDQKNVEIKKREESNEESNFIYIYVRDLKHVYIYKYIFDW